jgi:hypothetical protein
VKRAEECGKKQVEECKRHLKKREAPGTTFSKWIHNLLGIGYSTPKPSGAYPLTMLLSLLANTNLYFEMTNIYNKWNFFALTKRVCANAEN